MSVGSSFDLVSEQDHGTADNYAQRIEQLEAQFSNIDSTMVPKVVQAVDKAKTSAISDLRQFFTEQLLEGQLDVTKKIGENMKALAILLEGRVDRSRETHEGETQQMRLEQAKFQEEIRVAMASWPLLHNSSSERQANNVNGEGVENGGQGFGPDDAGFDGDTWFRGGMGGYFENSGGDLPMEVVREEAIGVIESWIFLCLIDLTQMGGYLGLSAISDFMG